MNKQDNCETDIQQESLTDLPLSGEQAEETKAGAGTFGGKCEVEHFNFVKKTDG